MTDDVIAISGPCKLKNTQAGYGSDVIGHDRKLKNELPNTNFPQITMQKKIRAISLTSFQDTKLTAT